MKTKRDIQYDAMPYGHIATIPKGTDVTPADNLPDDSDIKYWAKAWTGMSDEAESWGRNYGFGLRADEVTD